MNSSCLVAGLILVGGENRRYNGFPKGTLEQGGKTLFRHVYDQLSLVVDDIFISVHREVPPGVRSDLRVIRDQRDELRSPMNGLHSALSELARPVLVVPWDMPALTDDCLQVIVDQWSPRDEYEGIVIKHRGELYPFPGLYSPRLIPSLEESMGRGNLALRPWIRGRSFLKLRAKDFRMNERELERNLVNINRPEEFKFWLKSEVDGSC